jgi:hypothetical protein
MITRLSRVPETVMISELRKDPGRVEPELNIYLKDSTENSWGINL